MRSAATTPRARISRRKAIHHCHAPLQAGHPVRRGLSVKRKRLWNTGCPVEPGNDKKKLELSGLCQLDFNPQLNL